MNEIRVLLAEDQTLMRQGLRMILEFEPGFTVVGEAADGQAAETQALALRPDIVLMDVQMPGVDGVMATARIRAVLPETRVVVLTTFDDDTLVFDAIKAGASGYLLKDMPADELLAAIRRVHGGESIVQARLAARLIGEFARQRAGGSVPSPYEPLGERERSVLRLLADGHSNRGIGERLGLSEGTVKNYVSAILTKLHAANRTEAARRGREQGYVP